MQNQIEPAKTGSHAQVVCRARTMSFARVCCLVLPILHATESFALAQADKPIYVQYEGFVKNDDKTFLLSFAYINLNDTDIVIAAGDHNQFAPPPHDRHQPVTFLRGRQRSACVMVLPADFDGALRWTVKHGQHVSITTAKVLDPVYALTEDVAKRAKAGLIFQNAEKAVCLKLTAVLTPP
jgi:hypothetical protein